jgi:hypothetical protein
MPEHSPEYPSKGPILAPWLLVLTYFNSSIVAKVYHKVEINEDCLIVQEVRTTSQNIIQVYYTYLLRQIKLSSHTTKQLKLHPLRSLWTLKYITNYIRARREIMLEYWLPSTLHVCQNCLPEVPTKELISWSLGIIKRSLVEMFSSNTFPITNKA